MGLANALITDLPLGDGVSWGKAIDIGLSLVVSPVAGFLIAGGLLLALKRWLPLSKMHKTPEQRRELDNKKHPPFWNRLVLVLSAMGVSFVHGSNDGQKGIGLIMLVLIGIVPANFVLDTNSTTYQIERTRDAATHLSAFYHRNEATLGDYLALKRGGGASDLPPSFRCDPELTLPTIAALQADLQGVSLRRPAGRQAHRRAPLPAVPGRHGQKVARLEGTAGPRTRRPATPAHRPDRHHRIRALLGDRRGGAGWAQAPWSAGAAWC